MAATSTGGSVLSKLLNKSREGGSQGRMPQCHRVQLPSLRMPRVTAAASPVS